MLNNFNKFVASSVSMAYLAVLSWATAYAYGWGQTAYHGYPWWHVVQGGSMIARSLAYVCVVSMVLVIGYLIGYQAFKFIKRFFELLHVSWGASHLGFVKIFILLAIVSTPIMLLLYFYVGILSSYRLMGSVLSILAISLVCHKFGRAISFSIRLRELMSNEKYYQIFMAFIFVYVVVSAFSIGYLRSAFFTGYDIIEVENRPYYILVANGDEGFILGENIKHNSHFIFFDRKTLNHYTIHITPSPYLPYKNQLSAQTYHQE
ncbi:MULTISPECIES: hypothetical protein [Moraxella]|jgi:protein tfpB|nr:MULTISPECIES: hypothetical protein [Moraxella]MBE9589088.1 hypothetical protein [Moraxella sp. K1630]MBE9597622.1 hypothetical protein [Moraxella sp. K2450]MDH9220109.1 hypothetical protein [Moraxella lacunata]OBX59469.1 hypothetical protein A9Z63_11020 [Moraxella lacunata]